MIPNEIAVALEDGLDTTDETFALDGEDTSLGEGQNATEPFDPTKIRIETESMTVDLLVKRLKNDEIDMAPDFQRTDGIWKDLTQARLIESLLLRIPIPAFYLDASNDDHWIVVDGLQRLSVFRRFMIEESLVLQGLEFLKEQQGKKFSQLPRALQRRIEETQVTVYKIRAGTPPTVKFNLFKRINTGGLPLSPQEIRHALYQGAATVLLKDLASSKEFQEVTGGAFRDQRMSDRECVLRALAFLNSRYEEYRATKDFDAFLNEQLTSINAMNEDQRRELSQRFFRAMSAAFDLFGDDAFRKRYKSNDGRKPINKALVEAWTSALDRLDDVEIEELKRRKEALMVEFIRRMNKRKFDLSVSQGTGDTEKVKTRFSTVGEIIAKVLS